MLKPSWLSKVIGSYSEDERAKELTTALSLDPESVPNFTLKQGILRYKGRIYIGTSGELRSKLIAFIHDSPVGGYSGNVGTYQRLKANFFWPVIRKEVED